MANTNEVRQGLNNITQDRLMKASVPAGFGPFSKWRRFTVAFDAEQVDRVEQLGD